MHNASVRCARTVHVDIFILIGCGPYTTKARVCVRVRVRVNEQTSTGANRGMRRAGGRVTSGKPENGAWGTGRTVFSVVDVGPTQIGR